MNKQSKQRQRIEKAATETFYIFSAAQEKAQAKTRRRRLAEAAFIASVPAYWDHKILNVEDFVKTAWNMADSFLAEEKHRETGGI